MFMHAVTHHSETIGFNSDVATDRNAQYLNQSFPKKQVQRWESINGSKNKTEDSDEEIQRTNPSQPCKKRIAWQLHVFWMFLV